MRSSFEPSPLLPRPVFVAAEEQPTPEAEATAAAPSEPSALAAEYARGREEGRAELEGEYRAQLASALAALERAGADLLRVDGQEREALRRAVIELALALCSRLIGRELRADCDALAPLVGEALELLPPGGGFELVLSIADAERVREGHASELERLRSDWGAELVPDATIAPGEACVRSEQATVELRLPAILERFHEGLLERAPLPEERS